MELKEILTENYKLHSVVAVFKSDNNYFIQSHGTYIENDKVKLLEATPLSEKAWQDIAKTALKQNKVRDVICKGLMPENLIYFNNDFANKIVIWWEPAQVRKMYFTDLIEMPDGNAMQPPLLFVYNDEELDVFAMKENKRPDEKTKLFQPPYPNCSSNGSVCMGSAKILKSKDASDIIKNWSNAFWMSKFSHTGDDHLVKGNMNLLWKRQIENKTPFPLDVLKETKLTLKNLLK